MAQARRPRATYADIEAAPPEMVAELLDGELHLQPRPARPHTGAASDLGTLLGNPFRFGRGGPGGWIIYDEPELRLGPDVLVPDLAGWRTERLGGDTARTLTLAPDWVCEVLSPSPQRHARIRKLPMYARSGVEHAWLVDPLQRTVEAFRLAGAQWLLLGAWADDDVASIPPPFEAVPLELALLWGSSPPYP